MAENEVPMTSHSEAGANPEAGSRRIQADIDRTRAHMDSTFDALESKLTPGQLMQEGWDLLKGGSGAGAKKIFEIAREHPLPAAVIGVGLGLLLLDSNRKERGYDGGSGGAGFGRARAGGQRGYGYTGSPDYPGTRDARYGRGTTYPVAGQASGVIHQAGDFADQAKDKVSDLAGQAKDKVSQAKDKVSDLTGQAADKVSDLASQTADKVSDLTDTVREQASELGDKVGRGARQAKLGFWQLMEERPLVVGAATLAVGLLAGLAIPSTEAEDEFMGETRDQLLDRAQEGAREVLDKGKHVADSAVDTLKRTAESEGLSVDKLAEKVKHVAQETTEAVKNEASNQKLVPDLDHGQQQKPNAQGPGQPSSGQQGSGQPKPQQAAGQQASGQPNQQAGGQPAPGQPNKPQQPAGQPASGQPGRAPSQGDTAVPAHHEPELAKR